MVTKRHFSKCRVVIFQAASAGQSAILEGKRDAVSLFPRGLYDRENSRKLTHPVVTTVAEETVGSRKSSQECYQHHYLVCSSLSMENVPSHRQAGRSSQTLSTSQERTAPSFSLLPLDVLLAPPLSHLPLDLYPRISEAQPPRRPQGCLHRNSEETSTPVIANKRTAVEQGPWDWADHSFLWSFDSTQGFTSWFDQNRAAQCPGPDSGNWQLAAEQVYKRVLASMPHLRPLKRTGPGHRMFNADPIVVRNRHRAVSSETFRESRLKIRRDEVKHHHDT